MNKIKKTLAAAAILVGTCAAPVAALQSFGQELTDADGNAVSSNAAASSQKAGGGFYDIVFGSGFVGMMLWFALFGDGALAIYFSIDSAILIKPDKLMPRRLLDGVQSAMSEGDVVKAMEVCQQNPSAMASIVMAAFQHIEEGFEAIQEALRHELVRLDEDRRVNREVDRQARVSEQPEPEEHAHHARAEDDVVEAATRLLGRRRRVAGDRVAVRIGQFLAEGLESRHRRRARSNENRRRRQSFLDLVHLFSLVGLKTYFNFLLSLPPLLSLSS